MQNSDYQALRLQILGAANRPIEPDNDSNDSELKLSLDILTKSAYQRGLLAALDILDRFQLG